MAIDRCNFDEEQRADFIATARAAACPVSQPDPVAHAYVQFVSGKHYCQAVYQQGDTIVWPLKAETGGLLSIDSCCTSAVSDSCSPA